MPTTERYRDVVVIASRQHGVVTVSQLAAAGIGKSGVHRLCRLGRLTRIYRGVYIVGHTALTERGWWKAAVLAVGGDAVISHISAAQLHGMWRWRSPAHVHVMVPTNASRQLSKCPVIDPSRGVGAPVLQVRTSRHVARGHHARYQGIPARTPLQTIVDLGEMLTVERLVSVINEHAFKRGLNDQDIGMILKSACKRPGAPIVREAITTYLYGSAGIRSELEERVLVQLRRSSLPQPLVNTPVVLSPQRQIEVDMHWPDRKLVVEIDGPGHQRPPVRRSDRQRDTLLAAAGYTVLRFSARQVHRAGDDVIGEISSALDGEGG